MRASEKSAAPTPPSKELSLKRRLSPSPHPPTDVQTHAGGRTHGRSVGLGAPAATLGSLKARWRPGTQATNTATSSYKRQRRYEDTPGMQHHVASPRSADYVVDPAAGLVELSRVADFRREPAFQLEQANKSVPSNLCSRMLPPSDANRTPGCASGSSSPATASPRSKLNSYSRSAGSCSTGTEPRQSTPRSEACSQDAQRGGAVTPAVRSSMLTPDREAVGTGASDSPVATGAVPGALYDWDKAHSETSRLVPWIEDMVACGREQQEYIQELKHALQQCINENEALLARVAQLESGPDGVGALHSEVVKLSTLYELAKEDLRLGRWSRASARRDVRAEGRQRPSKQAPASQWAAM